MAMGFGKASVAIVTLDSGLIIKRRDTVCTHGKTKISMKVSGIKI